MPGTKRTPRKKASTEQLIDDLPSSIKHYRINGGRTHRITLTKRWTRDKEITRNFDDIKDARAFVAEQVKARQDVNRLDLSPDELAEARLATTKLKAEGEIPLQKVVEFYFSHGPGGREQLHLSEGVSRYLKNMLSSTYSPEYIGQLKDELGVVVTASGDMLLHDYTAEVILNLLGKLRNTRQWGALNFYNYFRDLRGLFGFLFDCDLIGIDPFSHRVFKNLKRERAKAVKIQKIEIYTVEECEKLLRAADLNPSLDLLGWFSVGFFSGARVEEMHRIKWKDFHWGDNTLTITKEAAAKGGRFRPLPISPVLRQWLDRVERKHGDFIDQKNLRNRLEKMFALARHTGEGKKNKNGNGLRLTDVQRKRNGLRHTFASYHYAMYDDAALTSKLLGHKGQNVMFDHYAEYVHKRNAEPFWKLFPKPLTREEEEQRRRQISAREEWDREWVDAHLDEGEKIEVPGFPTIPVPVKPKRGPNYRLIPLPPPPLPQPPAEEEIDEYEISRQVTAAIKKLEEEKITKAVRTP